MATNIEDLIKNEVQQAQSVKAARLYEKDASTIQHTKAVAEAVGTEAALKTRQNQLQTEVSDLQRKSIEHAAERQQFWFEKQAEVLARNDIKSENAKVMRDASKEDINAGIAKLEEIDEQRDKSNNPIGKFIHGIRYKMTKNALNSDIERNNLAVQMINQNYQEAGAELRRFRQGEFMLQSVEFEKQKALTALAIQDRSRNINLARQLNFDTVKATAEINNATRIDPDKGLKDMMSSAPFLFLHHASGNGGRQMTKQDAIMYQFYLQNASEEFKNAIGRGMFAWQNAFENGEVWGPDEIARNNLTTMTAGEYVALANVMPELGAKQLASQSIEGVREAAYARSREEFLKTRGIELGEGQQLSSDDREALQTYQQTEFQKTLNSTSMKSLMEDELRMQMSKRGTELMDPTGNEITPELFTQSQEFLQTVVADYMDPNKFVSAMADDDFRAEMLSTSGDNNGLFKKQVALKNQLVSAGLKDNDALELSAKLIQSYYQGRLLQDNPALNSMANLGLDIEFDLSVPMVTNSGRFGGRESATFSLTNPADIKNAEARLLRQSKYREQRDKRPIDGPVSNQFGGVF